MFLLYLILVLMIADEDAAWCEYVCYAWGIYISGRSFPRQISAKVPEEAQPWYA
jgi:hypothetical protein